LTAGLVIERFAKP